MSDLISRLAAITQLSHNKNKDDDEWELAGEKDCGKYEPEPPKWVNELMNDETFIRAMGQIKEGSET